MESPFGDLILYRRGHLSPRLNSDCRCVCDGQIKENGKPLFCAKDVAEALGHTNPERAIRKFCKGVTETVTPSYGGLQKVKFIPESDVYRLVMRSKLPSAERFQDWVVEEVLPTIRKTGRFEIAPALPQNMGDALQAAADLWRQNETLALVNTEQANLINEQAPKVKFVDPSIHRAAFCLITG